MRGQGNGSPVKLHRTYLNAVLVLWLSVIRRRSRMTLASTYRLTVDLVILFKKRCRFARCHLPSKGHIPPQL